MTDVASTAPEAASGSSAIDSPRSAKECILVRDAVTSDLDAICNIYNYYVLKSGDFTTFEEEQVPLEEILRRYENITAKNKFPYLVACIGDTVVGYAYGNYYHARESYKYSAENSIYLSAQYRRSGVGSALLAELLDRLRKRGCRNIVAVLGTQEDNPASFGLHSKFGFKQVALYPRIGFKHGRWVDRVHMQLSLLTAEDEANGPSSWVR